jgi:trimeric autotransporter adhesin
VPNDNHRDLPDVSLFASSGFNDSFYIICQSDVSPADSCALDDFGVSFEGVGGTSAAAPAFAGIMALVNQKQATGQNPVGRQGNANYFLYALAQQQNTANLTCNSSGTPDPKCVYHDVTKGNNSVPCAGTSPNCSSGKSGVNGVLVSPTALTTPAYTTAGGYDLATGLGTANVQNLVNKWSSVNTTATSTSLTLNGGSAVNITHGQAVPFRISVSPASATGDVSLLAVPTGQPTTAAGPFTLASGVAMGTTTNLPGGTSYYVQAHYEGNGTDAPSDSAPVTVTVGREPSKVFITVPVFDPTTGQETGSSPTTLVYGSPYILRADVTNAQGSNSALCVTGNCPTGTVTFADTVGGVSQGAPNSGAFGLNSAGYTEDQPVQFPGGVNVITATYSGDGSFSPPAQPTTYTLNVTPAPTQMSTLQLSNPFLVGTPVTIGASVSTGLVTGAAPTGTIAFYDGGVLLPGTVLQYPRAGAGTLDASVSATITTTFGTTGTHVITAVFSGDPSYASSTSAPANAMAVNGTSMTLTATPYMVFYGGSVTLTAVVTSSAKSPPMTGAVTFQPGSTVTQTQGTDANGNQTLTATTTITATSSGGASATYSGDANYEGNNSFFIVQVEIPDFSVNVNPPTVSLSAGQQTTTSVMVAPQTNQSSAVAMTCTESYLVGVSCAFSPASLNLVNGASVGSTLTLNATGAASTSKAVATRGAKRRAVVIFPGKGTWIAGGTAGAFALVLILWPPRRRRYGLAPALGTYAIVMVALGCGGGSSSGGGGTSGGGGVATTSIAITVPSKVASGAVFDVSAKVTSPNTLSGSVTFNDVTTGQQLAAFPVSDGSPKGEATITTVGFHQISASYSGDANNQPSQSSTVLTTVTGQGGIYVNGASNAITNNVVLTINIQ